MVAEVLNDWLDFLGGRPAEVVFAVSAVGPPPPVYADLVRRGRIDRVLDVPLGERTVNEIDPDAIREVVRAARTEWVLLVKLDTLPFRAGNGNWLAEDLALVEHHGLFGVTGSFRPSDLRPLDKTHSVTQKYSNNFSLFRRNAWLRVVDGGLGLAWDGPFAQLPVYQGDSRRYALEAAIESYLRESGERMLVRHESADWSVFHVNVWGDRLGWVRELYRRRYRIRPFLNDGRPLPSWQRHPWQWYYMYPKPPPFKRLRIWIGRLRRVAVGCLRRVSPPGP